MKISIKALLRNTVLVLFLGLGLILANNYYQIKGLENENALSDKAVAGSELALDVRFHVVQIQQFITDASLVHDADGVKESEEHLQKLKTNLNKIAELFPDQKKFADDLSLKADALYQTGVEMFHAYTEKGKEAGDSIMKRKETGLDDRSDDLSQSAEAFLEGFKQNEIESEKKVEQLLHRAGLLTMGLSLLVMVVGVGLLVRVYYRVKPMNQIGGNVYSQADEITAFSHRLKSITERLTETTTEQSAALHQSASAIEEISSMLKKTQESAVQLKVESESSREAAQKGNEAFTEIVENMNELRSQTLGLMNEVQKGNQEISTILKLFNEINDKTKMIDEIVFQTKLLSFNASVEAARAGENGKGFSVVAEEVGNLAGRSGQASQEIGSLLQTSLDKVNKIVTGLSKNINQMVAENQKRFDRSMEFLNGGSKYLTEILEKADRLKIQVDEIASAISEQTRGMGEINKAVQTLQKGSELTVQSAEEGKGISSEMDSSSQKLTESSSTLKVLVLGKSSEPSEKAA